MRHRTRIRAVGASDHVAASEPRDDLCDQLLVVAWRSRLRTCFLTLSLLYKKEAQTYPRFQDPRVPREIWVESITNACGWRNFCWFKPQDVAKDGDGAH
eukprot:7346756-Prymnesium_polylepis.1